MTEYQLLQKERRNRRKAVVITAIIYLGATGAYFAARQFASTVSTPTPSAAAHASAADPRP